MTTIDLRSAIGAATFSRFHAGLLFWTCVVVLFDMYDLMVYGSVLPVLIKEWHISPLEAGTIGSYGPLGMAVGAVLFGILADRFGRRRMLVTSIALFSVASALCAIAPGPALFAVLRTLAGIGIGGILPSAIAMLTDYAPKKLATTMVAVLMCAFSVGGILAALVAMVMLPAVGWRGVYLVAVVPLLLLPFMLRSFVDSPALLLARGRTGQLRATLARATGRDDLPADATFTGLVQKEPGSPVRALFTHGRALGTVMIWVAFFMCLLMINGLSTWLPNLMVQAGYALGSSLNFQVALNVGAIVGTLVLGGLANRWGIKRVLVPMFVISAVALALLGLGNGMALLLLLVTVTGATTMGAQNISYAFVSQYYPSFMRSTAVGLASGVGRVGAIVGPTFGGVLVAMRLPAEAAFVAFAVPGVIAALAFLLVPLTRRSAGDADADDAGAGDSREPGSAATAATTAS